MDKYSYCYDIKQARFFLQEGQRIIDVGSHSRTGRVFFVFERDAEGFQAAYDKWKTTRIYTV